MTQPMSSRDPEVRTAPMVDEWEGCYGSSWGRLITLESYAHPAKFSRALIERLYQHAVAEGWLVPGMSTVLDPFGGVALGAHGAVRHRLQWIGVELEQPFTDLGAGCDCTGMTKDDWVRFYGRWTRGRYHDGRYWCPACCAQAPQIAPERPATKRTFRTHPRPGVLTSRKKTVLFAPLPFPDRQDQYGPPVRQPVLGLCGITSAAYARGSGQIPSSMPHHYEGNIERWARQGYPGATLRRGDSRQLQAVLEGHGDCAIASPPYADGCRHTGGADPQPQRMRGEFHHVAYGQSAGQLGAMATGTPFDGAISSPPYEASWHDPGNAGWIERCRRVGISAEQIQRYGNGKGMNLNGQSYGRSEGQLGNAQSETFWSAARAVVSQLYAALKSGGESVADGEGIDFCSCR
jgi:hypothetical protein